MDRERNALVDTRQPRSRFGFTHRVSMKVVAMPDFNELLIEAHRVLDKARRLNDDSRRNGVDFVNTELDLSMTFAESA